MWTVLILRFFLGPSTVAACEDFNLRFVSFLQIVCPRTVQCTACFHLMLRGIIGSGELIGDQLTGPQCFYWSQVGTAQRWRCRKNFFGFSFKPLGKNHDFLPL